MLRTHISPVAPYKGGFKRICRKSEEVVARKSLGAFVEVKG
jgi:hypothetical protein